MTQLNDHNLLIAVLVLAAILLVWTIWITAKLLKLDRIRKHFFNSKIEKDLEQVLVDQNRSITLINETLEDINERLTDLAIFNKNDFKKIGFVRFNHIDGSGGNLSFALALLNEHHNGVVLSSLHGREGIRLYAKQISKKKSEAKLTQEEIKAIEEAR